MSKKSPVRSGLAVGCALTLAVALSAGLALATSPKKGWTYTTPSTAKVFVTFKVSSTGTKVVNLTPGDAVQCKGSAGGFPRPKPGSATITNQGTFKAVLKLYAGGSSGLKSEGTDTVTGRFVKGGKATGTVKTYFVWQSAGSFCKGVKLSYTAIGKA